MIAVFDHVFSYLKDNDLDATLDRFKRAGFLVDQQRKVRHSCGRLTGFAHLTSSYLEFLSVVDEAEFGCQADFRERLFRSRPQPYGIGAKVENARLVHRTLKQTFPEIPPVVTQAAIGKKKRKPAWTFCQMPPHAFPGAEVFGIQYHHARRARPELRQGPNTIFALGGFAFCSDHREKNLAGWKFTLSKLGRVSTAGSTLRFGAQQVEWISRAEYRRRTGQAYAGVVEEQGGIAIIKLLCADLREVRRSLMAQNFRCVAQRDAKADFAPDPNTGYTFELIQEKPARFMRHLNQGSPPKTRRAGP